MFSGDFPILSHNLDHSQVPPIHNKRMIAFLNHFVITTVNFLNKFSNNCETKLIAFEAKLRRVEASLMIVEAKLASIPNNKTTGLELIDSNYEGKTESDNLVSSEIQATNNTASEQEKVDIVKGIKACDDIRYKKYFKMLQFGVPALAVKLKMEAEGAYPNILDKPNLILEDAVEANL